MICRSETRICKDDVDSAIANGAGEPVERARILLGYREERWLFAVGQALGGIIALVARSGASRTTLVAAQRACP